MCFGLVALVLCLGLAGWFVAGCLVGWFVAGCLRFGDRGCLFCLDCWLLFSFCLVVLFRFGFSLAGLFVGCYLVWLFACECVVWF